MRKRLLSVYLLAEELGGFNIEGLQDRIQLQKMIYLMQVLGVDLRYRYTWYRYGTYCRDLTLDAYDIKGDEEIERASHKIKISPIILKRTKVLKKMIQANPQEVDKTAWLELLSSIHFLKHIASSPNEITKKNIRDALRRSGKTFSESLINKGWSALSGAGLIKNKKIPLPS